MQEISVEELKELNAELLKCLNPEKKDENRLVKIIKVLSTKKVTVKLLAES
jgi:hypothetical protein